MTMVLLAELYNLYIKSIGIHRSFCHFSVNEIMIRMDDCVVVHVYQLCNELRYCPGKEVINTSMNQNTLIDVVRSTLYQAH